MQNDKPHNQITTIKFMMTNKIREQDLEKYHKCYVFDNSVFMSRGSS